MFVTTQVKIDAKLLTTKLDLVQLRQFKEAIDLQIAVYEAGMSDEQIIESWKEKGLVSTISQYRGSFSPKPGLRTAIDYCRAVVEKFQCHPNYPFHDEPSAD